MARLFHMELDNNLFKEVGILASESGLSPAAFAERCIRQAINNKTYELFTDSKRNYSDIRKASPVRSR